MFKNFKNKKSGVTIIELMVVISIFAVISSTILVNYRDFSSSISTQNLADDIALSIRKAQGYAIGVRGYNNIFSGYGIHFAININGVVGPYYGSNKLFILFANINPNNNNRYDYTGGDLKICGEPLAENECLEALSITSSNYISSIEVMISGGNKERLVDVLDISFNRPNPEPLFCARLNDDLSDQCLYGKDVIYAKIIVSSLKDPDISKIIIIYNNGQISVS